MSNAGLTFQQILASLTTNPAERFGYAKDYGRIGASKIADLAVLEEDPAIAATAFARVRYTISRGQVVYRTEKRPRSTEQTEEGERLTLKPNEDRINEETTKSSR